MLLLIKIADVMIFNTAKLSETRNTPSKEQKTRAELECKHVQVGGLVLARVLNLTFQKVKCPSAVEGCANTPLQHRLGQPWA